MLRREWAAGSAGGRCSPRKHNVQTSSRPRVSRRCSCGSHSLCGPWLPWRILSYPSILRRLRCPFTNSLPFPPRATSGRRATGCTGPRVISGCPAPGLNRLSRGWFGRPGYWGWSNALYVWNAGYWGRNVGFYGGVNYGYGYSGRGYEGGYWRGNDFFYNRAVNNVRGPEIRNVYSKTVINNITVNNISYNGGTGGVAARPTAQEQTASRATPSAADAPPDRASCYRSFAPRVARSGQPRQAADSRDGKAQRVFAHAVSPRVAPIQRTRLRLQHRCRAQATNPPTVHSQALSKSSTPASSPGASRDVQIQRPRADLQVEK